MMTAARGRRTLVFWKERCATAERVTTDRRRVRKVYSLEGSRNTSLNFIFSPLQAPSGDDQRQIKTLATLLSQPQPRNPFNAKLMFWHGDKEAKCLTGVFKQDPLTFTPLPHPKRNRVEHWGVITNLVEAHNMQFRSKLMSRNYWPAHVLGAPPLPEVQFIELLIDRKMAEFEKFERETVGSQNVSNKLERETVYE